MTTRKFEGPNDVFLLNLNTYMCEQVSFIENDCFEIHTSQYKRLGYCLDDVFIYIVDNYNWIVVRNGTENSIKYSKCKILYQHKHLT